MKTKPLLTALVLLLGFTQATLADQKGAWGCPAANVGGINTDLNAYVRIWNFGDGGMLNIREVRVFDQAGQLYATTNSSAQVGAHQQLFIQLQQLLGLSPNDLLRGVQVIIDWEAASAARPHAEIYQVLFALDPTGKRTGTISNSTIECYELK